MQAGRLRYRWGLDYDLAMSDASYRRGLLAIGLCGPVGFGLILVATQLPLPDVELLPGLLLMLLCIFVSVIAISIYLGTRWHEPGPKDRAMVVVLGLNLAIVAFIFLGSVVAVRW